MKCDGRTIVALALLGGCIRERPPQSGDAGVSEALRPNPGRQVLPQGAKPDAAVAAAAPAPVAVTIEERLRRCDASVRGAVVRLSDDAAYAAEATATGPVIRLVRRAGGGFVCERYGVPSAAPRVALPDGVVTLATATDGAVGAGGTVLVELGADRTVRAATVIEGACAPGSTLRPVRLFAGAPSVQLRCWIATEGSWTAADQILHRDARAWQSLVLSESGRIVRSPTIATPPLNPALPGSIRVLETGASPRLEVASSSFDAHSGTTKFGRMVMRWNDAEHRFEPSAAPVVERQGGT